MTVQSAKRTETLAIAGSGAIACGLAATAARHGEVLLWARSDASAERARGTVEKVCGRLSGAVNASHVRIATDLEDLAGASVLVEAVAEDAAVKRDLLQFAAGAACLLVAFAVVLTLNWAGFRLGAPTHGVG